ncbi:hypothetical protein GCM10010300_82560 [Streptomyces olivaceoviridis]|nr:hypothetical protein GCM10010300_82560 [Streptomyces olivaceoviridis]
MVPRAWPPGWRWGVVVVSKGRFWCVAVDAADLDYRARTQTGRIPPHLVSRFLERGHAAEVEWWAGHGEWFCAREWARLLGEEGKQAEALEVLTPCLTTGWWQAIRATAELSESWGRADEAIVLTRARMEAGHPLAAEFCARLLTRHGRGDEVFTLLHLGQRPGPTGRSAGPARPARSAARLRGNRGAGACRTASCGTAGGTR